VKRLGMETALSRPEVRTQTNPAEVGAGRKSRYADALRLGMCGGCEQIARNVIATLWAAERVAIHDSTVMTSSPCLSAIRDSGISLSS
jgi:hypothetical protein